MSQTRRPWWLQAHVTCYDGARNTLFKRLRSRPHELRLPVPPALREAELVHARLQRGARAVGQAVRDGVSASRRT